jgi:hypothetical protein
MGVRVGVRRFVVVCGGFFLALSVMLGPRAVDARGSGEDDPVRPSGEFPVELN